MTLYLKHCGGLFSNSKEAIQQSFPVVNNLLPIFNYLKPIKSGDLTDYNTNTGLYEAIYCKFSIFPIDIPLRFNFKGFYRNISPETLEKILNLFEIRQIEEQDIDNFCTSLKP